MQAWARRCGGFGIWALIGAVAGLGQLPFDLPWLALLALACAFAMPLGPRSLAARARTRFVGGFGAGWALGCGYFLVTLHWITKPFMVDPARDGWMAPFGLFFMVTGLALFWGLGFGVARAVAPRHGRAVALVAAWAGAEMLRAHILTGFPWALPGHAWIGRGIGQTAALWGAHGLTLVTLGVAALVGWGLARLRREAMRGAVMVLVPLLALWGADVVLRPGPAPDAAEGPVIRIVQPNVPQQEKDDPDAVPVYVRRLMDLSAEAGPRDLVVWPETALPWLLDYMPDLLPPIADAAAAPLAMGVMRNEGALYYNSLAVIGVGGRIEAVYDKRHLVPFGEYVPFGDLAARFGIRGLAAADGAGYAAGQGNALMAIAGIGDVLPLICYESIFPEEMPLGGARPRMILLVTNDAWFGEFSGPYQHFALARLRAIETGLPVVRAANTGISAMIDGNGRVLASLDLGVAGKIDAVLPPVLPPPPYAQGGDWPVAVALCLLLAIVAGLRRKNGIDRASAPL